MKQQKTHEFQLDKWLHLYAWRVESMRSSEIRDLLAVTARPDIIAFAGGIPYVKALDLDKISEIVSNVIKNSGTDALQYGPSEGYAGLREMLVKYMADEDVATTADDIVLTEGSQQALEMLGKIFINSGDTIIAEAPSYVGALNAFLSYEANIIQIPMDKDGMNISILEKKLEGLKIAGIQPKFIYTVPYFQNPGGISLSVTRRKKLIKLARKYNTIILEDCAYRRLQYEGKEMPSLKTLDPKSVIYLGSFSKIFAPGLRVGWVIAPRPIREKLIFAKQAADLCSSNLTQYIVEQYLKEISLKQQLRKFKNIYRKRRDAMLEALDEFFPPGTRWTKPKGGFFIWATLPDYIDTTAMLAKAIQEKVAYVPGKAFFADGSGRDSMRLNFSYPEEKDIKEGIRRLSEVIEQEMELYKSLKQ